MESNTLGSKGVVDWASRYKGFTSLLSAPDVLDAADIDLLVCLVTNCLCRLLTVDNNILLFCIDLTN